MVDRQGPIPGLDGVRALAVGVVIASHAGLSTIVPGQFGVTVFFFLSGYLITTLMREEHLRTGRVDVVAFFIRRAFRILPPLYVVLGGATVLTLTGFLTAPLGAWSVIAQAVHLTNYDIILHGWWYGRAPGTWILWSLAVEEHFYLVFPFVFLLLASRVRSGRRQALILLGVCAAVLAWRCILVFALHAPKDRTYLATDTRIDSILFGCALALGANPVLDRVRVSRGRLRWLLVPAGLAVLLVTFVVPGQAFGESFRYSLQGLALAPLFVAAIADPGWWLVRALSWRWMRRLGVLSYALYLVHPVVIDAVAEHVHANRAVRGLLAVALSLVLAEAVNRLIEVPAGRLRRRVEATARPPSREPVPAAA